MYFKTLTQAQLAEVSRKGGLAKNPKKGTGSLSKRERKRRAKEAAKARWHKEDK